mgnify:CR=1 FL=1
MGEKSIPPKIVNFWNGFNKTLVMELQSDKNWLVDAGKAQLPMIDMNNPYLKIWLNINNTLIAVQAKASFKLKSISLTERKI